MFDRRPPQLTSILPPEGENVRLQKEVAPSSMGRNPAGFPSLPRKNLRPSCVPFIPGASGSAKNQAQKPASVSILSMLTSSSSFVLPLTVR